MSLDNPTTTTKEFLPLRVIGTSETMTIDEFERRKDRFRRATKEYYEQAERNFRCLHGFGSNCYASKQARKKMSNDVAQVEAIPKRTLKRCRPRRSTGVMPIASKLEAELVLRLLESHFRIVIRAIENYFLTITNLVRPWPKPLPVPCDNCHKLSQRLDRHHSEAGEELLVAMASVMAATRETRVTKELAQKIYEQIESVCMALRQVTALLRANSHNMFHCCRYDHNGDHVVQMPSTKKVDQGTVSWNQTVVEAQKLDAYYSWFRANNGVLLNGKERSNDRREYKVEDDGNHRAKRPRKGAFETMCFASRFY